MKVFKWIWDNILFLITLFLLVFIPLYPKLPLLDVSHTWVYVRAEDFVVAIVLLVWLALLVLKKITLKTPLTFPILAFWIAGGLATIHGVLLIFPDLSNVFPSVAFLSFLRRIEYMSLFFIAYAAVKDKRMLPYIVAALALTLLAVTAYGVGQKYLGFPAYLTMNEEFAKGTPIQLSALSRIPSTFAGHYDLAAYLVLVVPILASMIFGFKNILLKLLFSITVVAGVGLLLMTVSRVSFVVLLLSLFGIFYLHKKKLVLVSLPILAIIFVFLFINFAPRLLDRYGSTVKEIDVLVNTENGEPVGHIKEINPQVYKEKIVRKKNYTTVSDIDPKTLNFQKEKDFDPEASSSAFVLSEELSIKGIGLVPPNAPNGETLPQGTGYANLSLSPVRKQVSEFFYELPRKDSSGAETNETDVYMFSGNFLIKRASAYDLSFTTRYQGEWPNAIEAFKRNIFFGSGYSSISLAIDNSYLRMLGEIGGLGFFAFLSIFLIIGIYIKKTLPQVDSPVVRSFVLGFSMGVIGLALNATLIDVFEASKVAFYLWMLTGLTLGILHLYQVKQINLWHEFKKLAMSSASIIVYLGILIIFLYSPMVDNYFTGDDFTWLRWAADCTYGFSTASQQCPSVIERISHYFTDASGFFYRPGTKVFFMAMYSAFSFNQTMYHIVTLVLHFIVAALVFLLAKKILKDFRLSVLAAFLFVMLSTYYENIFWIASVGHVITSLFILLSLYLFILWEEKKKAVYLVLSVFSIAAGLLFQEAGVIAPLLILVYKFTSGEDFLKSIRENIKYYVILFAPVFFYLFLRLLANSHWSGGDYSYNLFKLPFNIVGNAFGYVLLSFFGPMAFSIYEPSRDVLKANLFYAGIVVAVVLAAAVFVYKKLRKILHKEEKKIVLFGLLFMAISLLPFLGLGNITSRYTYLASVGFVILLSILIKKLYSHLLPNGREVAVAGIAVLMSIFVLLQIIQVQKIHGDWHEAGLRVHKVFVSIERLYSDTWSTQPIDLYLANVPVRAGEAWVFPVGLNDAAWFLFKNPKITIHQDLSVEQALDLVTDPLSQKVLLFNEQGDAVEKKKVIEPQ